MSNTLQRVVRQVRDANRGACSRVVLDEGDQLRLSAIANPAAH